MVELVSKSALDGLGLPFEAGSVTLSPADPAEMVSISPYKGNIAKVSTALKNAVGAGLSEVGSFEASGDIAVIWSGRNQWFVQGPEGMSGKLGPVRKLAGVTQQGDGWACVEVTGPGAADALARLCPLDFETMSPGDAARSEFQHMQSVIRATKSGFEVMVFRSMARTLVHDLKGAVTSVAAQRNL